jgi:hypothetical protein
MTTTRHDSSKSADGHVFNDDLLINEDKNRGGKSDLEWATDLFPQIIHVLDNPELREKFSYYELKANSARDRQRAFGFTAVTAMTISLIATVTTPFWPQNSLSGFVSLVIEAMGMLAAIVAVGGLWHGNWKHRWLESRLMTERLRQWHFQILVHWGAQIENSCRGPKEIEAFKIERTRAFSAFLLDYEGHQDAKLQALVDEPEEELWMHEAPTSYSSSSTPLAWVFEAYERLRFRHQHGYAVHKLRESTPLSPLSFLKWPPVCQKKLLGGASSTCFVVALLCSVSLLYCQAKALPNVGRGLGATAVLIAVFGAALRAIEQGLGINEEIERFSDYRSRISHLHERFKRTNDTKEKLHLMEELELASVDEMKSFLRTHYKAKFAM